MLSYPYIMSRRGACGYIRAAAL
uniref:Uncharacterized protein n=1 Tax=Arundo donax TaxID=35708 RepID=A0A0A8ZVK9_ARUDO